MAIIFLLAQLAYGSTVSATVIFVAGPVDPNISTLVSSPNNVVADGNSTAVLVFTSRDAYSNAVAGTAVTLSASGTNNTFGATSGATDSNGVFTTTLASTYAQSQTVTASFGSQLNVTTSLRFVAGTASNMTSSLVLNPNTQIANNTNTIVATLTLKDATGNAIANVTPSFFASGSSTTISSPSATSFSGQTSVTYQTSLAQNENALVTSGALSFLAPMAFYAGPPVMTSSSLAANPNIAAGNGTSTISLVSTARDAQGNPVSGVNVAFTASGGNTTFAAPSGTTNNSGVYMTTLTSTQTQTETLKATIAANFSQTANVTFTGAASASTSTLAVNPNMQTVGPGNTIVATLTLMDSASNRLASVSPTWSASGSSNTIAANGNTSASGVATATYSSTLAQNESITVSAGGISLTAPIVFLAGSPNSNTSNFSATPSRQVANNSNVCVANVTLLDAYYNPVGGQTVNFAASGNASISPMSASTNSAGYAQAAYRSATIGNQNALLTAGTLSASTPVIFTDIPTRCTLSVSPNNVVADGNTAMTLTANVFNNSNSAVANVQVTLFTSGSANRFVTSNPITTATGQVTSSLASLYAGVDNFTARAGAIQCVSQGNFLTRSAYCANNPNYTNVARQAASAPASNALADFNLDGTLDLATIYAGSANMVIAMGNGDGTFQPSVSYPTGNTPSDINAVDLNGDGFSDLVVSNGGSNTIGVFLNKTNGTFTNPINYATGTVPRGISSADFNSDGVADLMVNNRDTTTLDVYLGQGNGFMSARTVYSVGHPNHFSTVGDFNNDGKLDAAVNMSDTNQVGVFLGLGDGTFQAIVNYAVGFQSIGVASGDFNGDGRLDIVAANQNDATISLLLGNGDGTFQPQAVFPASSYSHGIVVGDFNGDSKQDVAVSSLNESPMSILLGTGSGSFQAKTSYAAFTASWRLIVGDVNADGRQDIVCRMQSKSSVGVLLYSSCN